MVWSTRLTKARACFHSKLDVDIKRMRCDYAEDVALSGIGSKALSAPIGKMEKHELCSVCSQSGFASCDVRNICKRTVITIDTQVCFSGTEMLLVHFGCDLKKAVNNRACSQKILFFCGRKRRRGARKSILALRSSG